jgi:hypothetical protein
MTSHCDAEHFLLVASTLMTDGNEVTFARITRILFAAKLSLLGPWAAQLMKLPAAVGCQLLIPWP